MCMSMHYMIINVDYLKTDGYQRAIRFSHICDDVLDVLKFYRCNSRTEQYLSIPIDDVAYEKMINERRV